MQPDYQLAATRAAETLIRFGVSTAPVSPLPLLKRLPGVLVFSYQTMSDELDQNRRCVMDMFGEKNQDAFTSVRLDGDKKHYMVTYNALLPFHLLQRALARELGHIILDHDGTRPEEVRNEEARCFAHHLLVPRALIWSVQKTNLRVTTEVIGSLTGCYDYCLSCLRKTPPIRIPAELNRKVRDQFLPYVMNFFDYQQYAARKDGSALADLGTYMDGYEE